MSHLFLWVLILVWLWGMTACSVVVGWCVEEMEKCGSMKGKGRCMACVERRKEWSGERWCDNDMRGQMGYLTRLMTGLDAFITIDTIRNSLDCCCYLFCRLFNEPLSTSLTGLSSTIALLHWDLVWQQASLPLVHHWWWLSQMSCLKPPHLIVQSVSQQLKQ